MDDHRKFQIYIYKEAGKYKEKLKVRGEYEVTLPLFGLANALFEVWPKENDSQLSLDHFIDDEKVSIALRRFTYRIGAYKNYVPRVVKTYYNSKIGDDMTRVAGELAFAFYETEGFHFENPINFTWPFKDTPIPRWFKYGVELMCIERALDEWLSPEKQGRAGNKHRETPTKRYASSWSDSFSPLDLECLMPTLAETLVKDNKTEKELIGKLRFANFHEVRLKRNRQVIRELCSVKSENVLIRKENGSYKVNTYRENKCFSVLYTSQNGLLPLVWAEILYAVENDIYAKRCEICGKIIPLPSLKGKYNLKYCSDKCKRKAEKEANKRIANYKEIQRLRMRRSRATTQEEKDRLTEEIEKLRGES